MQPQFKIRCSAIGKIMTEPVGKGNLQKYHEQLDKVEGLKKRLSELKPTTKTYQDIEKTKLPKALEELEELEKVKHEVNLSETCKTCLHDWIIEVKYGRKKEISSKTIDKGNFTEQEGFQLINDVLYPDNFLVKNKVRFSDDFMIGEPDIVVDSVIDNKSSWDIFTFPFQESKLNKDYYLQVMGYMHLTGKQKAIVAFTLNDMPVHIAMKNAYIYNSHNGGELNSQEMYDYLKNQIYTKNGLESIMPLIDGADTSDFIEIPKEKRIKCFEVEYDKDVIFSIQKRVLECRKYINKIFDLF